MPPKGGTTNPDTCSFLHGAAVLSRVAPFPQSLDYDRRAAISPRPRPFCYWRTPGRAASLSVATVFTAVQDGLMAKFDTFGTKNVGDTSAPPTFLILDTESVPDGRLISKIKYPGEDLPP